jgi:osmotically-inducible protein OsmY
MNPERCTIVLALAIALCLPGCTGYEAYRKCGWHGCPGDEAISTQVRTLLEQHPALGPPNHVYVQTADGVVFLSGRVATDLQRETAESVAREASGVREVINSIALTYEGR